MLVELFCEEIIFYTYMKCLVCLFIVSIVGVVVSSAHHSMSFGRFQKSIACIVDSSEGMGSCIGGQRSVGLSRVQDIHQGSILAW